MGFVSKFKKKIGNDWTLKKFVVVIAMLWFSINTIKFLCNRFIKSTPFKPSETLPTDEVTCIDCHQTAKGASFLFNRNDIPQCPNLVQNMVQGKWVQQKYDTIENENEILHNLLVKFRVKHEGFSGYPFRIDGKCGYRYQLPSPNFRYIMADSSTWCDPRSDKPCCSHYLKGLCVKESECGLKESVNLKEFAHAELSNWIPADISCQIKTYKQESACGLLHSKKVKSIGFIGNSLMRNMYSAALQMLTNNFHNGSIGCCIPPSLRKKCVGHWQNYDKFCLGQALVTSSKELPGSGVCNSYKDLELYHKGYWMAYMGNELKQHIIELLDRPGTYLLVGIGVHDRHNYRKVISKYLRPSFEILSGHEWPKFIWIHSLKTGIFKPPSYVSFHGTDDDIDTYVEEIGKFCARHSIPALDFRPLTTGVWSVDGTHYGTGVNVMKMQMFLNLLASNQVF